MSQVNVQRQIVLPMSKAVEIAYKSIRLRLARSLVVTSGIVLALAFLMSILASESITGGMRDWAAHAPRSPQFNALRTRELEAEAQLTERVSRMRQVVAQDAGRTPDASAFKTITGESPEQLRKQLGGFPMSNDDMGRVAALDPAALRAWLDAINLRQDLRDELSRPQRLEAQMRANGLPSTPEEISNSRVQKRWLVGLALLVAFVGILNAMLMSVTERFREIGTMKCLGALDSFIIKLFLIESLFQGVVGTLIGAVAGLILSLVSAMTGYGRLAVENLPAGELAISFGICVVVGVLLTVGGAVYPAWQAARMQPIEAMRVDT